MEMFQDFPKKYALKIFLKPKAWVSSKASF